MPSPSFVAVGLDLNATRLRAVVGPVAGPPEPIDFGDEGELPAAISLASPQLEVGRAGMRFVRRSPHLACVNFLPALGTDRVWSAHPHAIRSDTAVSLLLSSCRPVCDGAATAIAVPAYLTHLQVGILTAAAEAAGIGSPGTVPAPVAVAVGANLDLLGSGLALVIDVDDHALTWSAVMLGADRAWLVGVEVVPALRLGAWKELIVHRIAERCIRQSRRDPRDCADAEQAIGEQLDHAMEAASCGQPAEIGVSASRWFQTVVLHPAELVGVCARLARAAVEAMRRLLETVASPENVTVILATPAAARLPGLLPALEACASPPAERDLSECEDFGEGLLDAELTGQTGVRVVDPDAAARGAWHLAAWFAQGGLSVGHLETVPLSSPPRSCWPGSPVEQAARLLPRASEPLALRVHP